MKRKPMRSARIFFTHPLLRVLPAGLCLIAVVLVFAWLSTLMRKPNPVTAAADPVQEAVEATPSPVPTITPTPAVYAPFGAQYGYGGAELIPDTPTPAPTDTPALATAAPASPSGYHTLKKGASGEDVVRMQQALIELGYLTGAADGSFGSGTQSAVTQFQAVNGLSADGIAGTRTLTLLYSGDALSAAQAPKMDYLLLVNRDRPLGKDYVPTDLVNIADVIPSDVLTVKYKNTQANRVAAEALCRMLEDAIADGLSDFQVSSAYRGYAAQQQLVDNSVASFRKNNPSWSTSRCLSATYQTVAPAGTSEHMTGLAFDITVPGVSFTGTAQQKWLHEHCYEYGFIVRFTKEKEAVTGFLAESWHFRYVGVQAAQVMSFNNWCLEEYVERMGL